MYESQQLQYASFSSVACTMQQSIQQQISTGSIGFITLKAYLMTAFSHKSYVYNFTLNFVDIANSCSNVLLANTPSL